MVFCDKTAKSQRGLTVVKYCAVLIGRLLKSIINISATAQLLLYPFNLTMGFNGNSKKIQSFSYRQLMAENAMHCLWKSLLMINKNVGNCFLSYTMWM